MSILQICLIVVGIVIVALFAGLYWIGIQGMAWNEVLEENEIQK